MKHWYRTIPAKITCFILCVITVCITVISVIGAVIMIDANVYATSEELLVERRIYDMLISDSYNIVGYSLHPEEYFHRYYDTERNYAYTADTSNIRYQLLSEDGSLVKANVSSPDAWKYTYTFAVRDNIETSYFNIRRIDSTHASYNPEKEDIYILNMYLENGLPVNDKYSAAISIVHTAYSLRYWIYPIGAVSLLMSIALFAVLMCVSARRPESDELHPGVLNRVPFDLLIAAAAVIFTILVLLMIEGSYNGHDAAEAVILAVSVIAGISILLGLCMSAAARIKQRTILKNNVIYMAGRKIWIGIRILVKCIVMLLRSIPLVWRTLVIAICFVFFDLFLLVLAANGEDAALFFWAMKYIILVPAVLYMSIFMRKLQKGGDALAKGDLSYKIDTKMMYWDFKRHGENLNSIAGGMTLAVEERLQSERMKAELITNVSHDIKTPLTSIINYAGLISEEACGSDKHKEYAEVLVRKSEHLKRLLDDLVEISKATTGNLEVELIPCEAGVLLTQASGEFEQRCLAAGLELITTQPDRSIKIMADSRRIWRVFENLMSNVCKYSLPGSRVYLSLEQQNNEALFIFRNTSRAALNISPEELMERFVRGDTSRSTEGNGLGLSIARSLTELQNGKMDISIDGDLFKVTLRFPIL